MKRILPGNPNTPEAFNGLWRGDMEAGRRPFDLYRFRAMMAGIGGGRVLEIGCGCSEFLSFLLNHQGAAGYHTTATGLDYSPWALGYMRQIDPRVHWVEGDALATGLPAGSFDAVIAGELIEHMDEPQRLVDEMARLTAPHGLFRITTLLPHLQASDAYHVWQFEREDLEAMFATHAVRVTAEVVGNYFVVTGFR